MTYRAAMAAPPTGQCVLVGSEGPPRKFPSDFRREVFQSVIFAASGSVARIVAFGRLEASPKSAGSHIMVTRWLVSK